MGWIQTVVKIIPLIVGAVHAVEKIAGAKKGKEKQDAAIEAIGAMISALELSFNKELMDVPEFQELVRKLIDDYVAVQNFAKEFQSKKQ